uniref:Uncharacterized protein n=1 Tax=Oryza nivara TaxID=4536 RepID=A0A0E0IP74_ORYNI
MQIHKKKPSQFTWRQFYDSAFVMVNGRLKQKGEREHSDPILPYLPDEDEPYVWLADMHENDNALIDVHKDEIRVMLTAPSINGEEGPSHYSGKGTPCDASCPKQAKEPWHDDLSFEEEHEGRCEDERTHCSKRKKPSNVSCSKLAKNPSRVTGYRRKEEELRHSSKKNKPSSVPCSKQAKGPLRSKDLDDVMW